MKIVLCMQHWKLQNQVELSYINFRSRDNRWET